ncbi:hypothetical protein [uncultured Microscilla sp.]|nr:hypothetical protein [uncultured Microscilla sp.]
MKKLECIAIDDEFMALEAITHHSQKIPLWLKSPDLNIQTAAGF